VDTLAGKYSITKPLGRGGMGTVYCAEQRHLRRSVAIKVLHAQHAGNDALTKRFFREAIAVSQLRSKYVVRIFDSDTTPAGEPFIVMELLSGQDLSARLRQGLPDVKRVVDWIIQICSAMYEAHTRGLIHRDLKPSNIFLAEPDETVRVVDFGISKITEGAELTAGSEILGTPHYIAPEVLQGVTIDARVDIYAIGVIAYRALSGAFPCDAANKSDTNAFAAIVATVTNPPKPLGEHRPDLPPGLVDAVMKALEKSPAQRYANAKEMAEAFAPFGSGELFFEDLDLVTSISKLKDISSFPPPSLIGFEEKADDSKPPLTATKPPFGPELPETATVELSELGTPLLARGVSAKRREPWLAMAGAIAVLSVIGFVWGTTSFVRANENKPDPFVAGAGSAIVTSPPPPSPPASVSEAEPPPEVPPVPSAPSSTATPPSTTPKRISVPARTVAPPNPTITTRPSASSPPKPRQGSSSGEPLFIE
jgi:serine/threonine-protein kinase